MSSKARVAGCHYLSTALRPRFLAEIQMTDLAAEAERLADALEQRLEHEGYQVMRYVPMGMSCSLGYTVDWGDGHSISRKITLRKVKK